MQERCRPRSRPRLSHPRVRRQVQRQKKPSGGGIARTASRTWQARAPGEGLREKNASLKGANRGRWSRKSQLWDQSLGSSCRRMGAAKARRDAVGDARCRTLAAESTRTAPVVPQENGTLLRGKQGALINESPSLRGEGAGALTQERSRPIGVPPASRTLWITSPQAVASAPQRPG